ncbi:lipocalin-like domain-containing protein [Chitinophaga arvensicola]|nr:lipocalin family protein [Chitinophaga arvensicola]
MKQTLMSLAVSGLFFSCQKEKSGSPECSINVASLSGGYKLTALQYKSTATAAAVDYLAFMDACEKDDIITLDSKGTYDYNDAGTICTPEKKEHGTWQLNGNILTSDGTLNGTIASYDCKTLIYYVENTIVPGDRLTFTMAKQ